MAPAAGPVRARRTVEAPRPCRRPLPCAARPPPRPDIAIASAREAARTAPTLEALRELMQELRGLRAEAHRDAAGVRRRHPQARIMFVGEAPGRDEDIEELPFVGRSGKLLDLDDRRNRRQQHRPPTSPT